MFGGDRRMEAESYLSSGFEIRLSIERKQAGWRQVGDIARVWMPGRLKGIQVASDVGTPFLAATQVFDLRPIPRKWLALARTYDSSSRFVKTGQILVTCSGSVGRTTIAYEVHEDTLISHDLLRVDAIDESRKGWLYAFLHSPQAKAMATGSHYGHIIKHLETSHIESLPIPEIEDDAAERFNDAIQKIIALRNKAHRLTLEAESKFEQALGKIKIDDWGENGFSTKASGSLLAGRKRLEAAAHNPGVESLYRHFEKQGKGFSTVVEAGYDVWVPGRYKRIPAADGVIYRDSEDLMQVNPDLKKRYADCRFGDNHRGRVKAGWILMPSSGQVYGIIGTAIIAADELDGQVVSNHVIRIAPKTSASIRLGYLVTALSHPTMGRPAIKALAFGSSVPEIETEDLAAHRVVRLSKAKEDEIADLAEEAAKARSDADLIEQQMGTDAGEIIEQFIQT